MEKLKSNLNWFETHLSTHLMYNESMTIMTHAENTVSTHNHTFSQLSQHTHIEYRDDNKAKIHSS